MNPVNLPEGEGHCMLGLFYQCDPCSYTAGVTIWGSNSPLMSSIPESLSPAWHGYTWIPTSFYLPPKWAVPLVPDCFQCAQITIEWPPIPPPNLQVIPKLPLRAITSIWKRLPIQPFLNYLVKGSFFTTPWQDLFTWMASNWICPISLIDTGDFFLRCDSPLLPCCDIKNGS